jgi:lysophospholipase L1-like esterase
LTSIVARIRENAPQTAILMMGPPDCGQKKPLLHLDDVIESQRSFAREQNVAFFDWRAHMGGPRSVIQWVTAGFGQRDYIHLTGDGYRLSAQMLLTALDQSASTLKANGTLQ